MMKSSYNTLFRIELLHEYFANRQCRDFEIVPSPETRVMLNRAKIICRNTDNKLLALIQQNDSGDPFFNTSKTKQYRNDFGGQVFRFYLKINNALFYNYTNLNVDLSGNKCFYFSNLAANKASNYLFVSSPVAAFTAGKQYLPGDLAQDPANGKVYEALKKYSAGKITELSDPLTWTAKELGSAHNTVPELVPGKTYHTGDLVKQPKKDNLFEALRKHSPDSPAALNDASLWKAREQGNLQFANENDQLECCGSTYNFKLAGPAKKLRISILGFNYDKTKPAYDVPAREDLSKSFDQPAESVGIDLAGIAPGKYLLRINDEERLVYYDPAIRSGKLFGVIEIFNFLGGSDDYSLLTGDEKLRHPDYQLLFAARRVLWKFIRKDGRAESITDSGDTGYQFSRSGDGFVSSSPIPLSENVIRTLSLEFNTTDFRLSPLPNPSPERFSKCTQDDYDYLCSEIYLNY
jgi:hypothetical protein